MHFFHYLILLLSKIFFVLLTKFKISSGSTWPGHAALIFDPQFVKHAVDNSSTRVILVIGTNGKTTTARMISHLLKKSGKRVLQNTEGANLVNGIASTLIRNSTWGGRLNCDFAIFEIDENNLSPILSQISPDVIVCLNLFRDQLDRYGEVNTVADSWKKQIDLLPISTRLVLNADDPLIRYFGEGAHPNTFYFSIPSRYLMKSKLDHDVDSIYCPIDDNALSFSKISYSHIGKYRCSVCGYTNASAENFSHIPAKNYPMGGLYNFYNVNAAVLTALKVLQEADGDKLFSQLSDFVPAFGRGEKIIYKEREFVILLSKNPAGFNQSLQLMLSEKNVSSILFMLNDNIPDGRDISWIWDVDFEMLSHLEKNMYLTGTRSWDLANRFQYADIGKNHIYVHPSPEQALNVILEKSSEGDLIYILPTYSAMLEIRSILTGQKFL